MNTRNRPQALLSALAKTGAGQAVHRTPSLAFYEIETRSAICLRALPGSAGNHEGLEDLPDLTGECRGDDPATLCLRPGEWLVVSETLASDDLLGQLRAQYHESGFLAWDQSDGLALIRVEGPAAPWLLRKHCGLDVPDGGHRLARCARARFAHISVLVRYHTSDMAYCFDIWVDRSYALYLWNLLADSVAHAGQLFERFGAKGPVRS